MEITADSATSLVTLCCGTYCSLATDWVRCSVVNKGRNCHPIRRKESGIPDLVIGRLVPCQALFFGMVSIICGSLAACFPFLYLNFMS